MSKSEYIENMMMQKIIQTCLGLLQILFALSLCAITPAHGNQVDVAVTSVLTKTSQTAKLAPRTEKASTLKSPIFNQLLKDAQAHKNNNKNNINNTDDKNNRALAKFIFGHSNAIDLSHRNSNFVLYYLFGG